MYRISKRFTFSAAHALTGLPPEHQCSRIHGHNYIVELFLQSEELDTTDFVRDYGRLGPFKAMIDNWYDHRWLGYGPLTQPTPSETVGAFNTGEWTNPVLSFNPTAENMAKHMFESAHSLGFRETYMVGVSETPNTWAFYEEPK